jgi:hypothetical protein
MPDDEFYTPTNIDRLRMENELLAFEVHYLKAKLSGGGGMPGTPSSVSLSRLSQLEAAETDLRLLLQKLASSPAAPAFRLNKSFRTLEERYLRAPRPAGSSPQRVAYLEGAENDLKLLLQKMASSPAASVLRRSRSFRTLEERYL